MGKGLYNYPKMMTALQESGYAGFISIEDFDPSRSEEEKLREGIRYLRSLL